ncbi:hypothetical protein TWF696_000592 [Orbilia brochopaga]|uniref:F-box domain-containing protein n=1 Tax=Orbilia brochopaga TaxID=3140254 RepID=A0AAV9VDA9_9PEZI
MPTKSSTLILELPVELQVKILSYLIFEDQILATATYPSWGAIICAQQDPLKSRYLPHSYVRDLGLGVHRLLELSGRDNSHLRCTVENGIITGYYLGRKDEFSGRSSDPEICGGQVTSASEPPVGCDERYWITDCPFLDEPVLSSLASQPAVSESKTMDDPDSRYGDNINTEKTPQVEPREASSQPRFYAQMFYSWVDTNQDVKPHRFRRFWKPQPQNIRGHRGDCLSFPYNMPEASIRQAAEVGVRKLNEHPRIKGDIEQVFEIYSSGNTRYSDGLGTKEFAFSMRLLHRRFESNGVRDLYYHDMISVSKGICGVRARASDK